MDVGRACLWKKRGIQIRLRPFLVIDMFTDYEEESTALTRRLHLAALTLPTYTRSGLFKALE